MVAKVGGGWKEDSRQGILMPMPMLLLLVDEEEGCYFGVAELLIDD